MIGAFLGYFNLLVEMEAIGLAMVRPASI